MNENDFKIWLEEKGLAPNTVSARISNAKRIEQYLGDLDDLFSAPEKDKVLEQFNYTTADEREGRPNPSPVPIDGDWRTGLATLRSALELYRDFLETQQSRARSRIEGAFNAYDSYRTNGAHTEIFEDLGEPSDYWVRSSRERENRVYPTKPINRFVNSGRAKNGGWLEPLSEASALHNAGFIIVSEDDTPVEVPPKAHLVGGAGRIRLCALNYFIEPSREKSDREVSIRADDLATAMGLKDAFPNICQALGGKKFQKLANVPPPKNTQPNPSSSTVFTYTLNSQPEADAVTSTINAPTPSTVNLILYGPPGTGKTYQTAWEAVRLCLGEQIASGLENSTQRAALMHTYRDLVSNGRIEFVTFHQSMSYEEFIEGLRPTTGNAEDKTADTGFRLEPVAGIFRRISERAKDACDIPLNSTEAHQQNDTATTQLFTVGTMPSVRKNKHRDTAQDVARRLDSANPDGFSLEQYLDALNQESQKTGEKPTNGWHEWLPWVTHAKQSWLVPVDQKGERPDGLSNANRKPAREPENFVLIIDEINRANISKVFGELITLLEPDKRLGRDNEIRLTLPYSRKYFGVPQNLHVIGTMNTADRSIALLDTALRRRFSFKELMPDPSILSSDVDGIDLQKLLSTINERIEYLFDRDHQIGHGYFTGCQTRGDIETVMRDKVIPLLAEYFYEDWSKVAAILGDAAQKSPRFLEAQRIAAPSGMTKEDFSSEKLRWTVKNNFDFSDFFA